MTAKPTYQKPGFATQHIFNPLIATATRLGVSMRGSRVLSVRGRKSGEWRSTPVNPLTVDGERYLVAPRGNTQWARNIRVSKEGVLRLGRKSGIIRVEEVPDEQKVPLLRAYLKAWAWETKVFFEVENADVPDEVLAGIAPDHPIFHILK
jgi:deazaflavin-dependent oxidoreductase (nitroreductase family)